MHEIQKYTINNSGLILVSFSQTRTIVAQPVSDDLCEEMKTGILTRRANCYSQHCEEQWNVHNNGCAMTSGNSSKLLVELIVLIFCSF